MNEFCLLRFFVSKFWVCSPVLGLFRIFHTHTPRCSTPTPRIFVLEFWVCSRVLGLFQTFHTHTHTHHGAQRPPHDFFSRALGFLSSFSFVWIDPSRCTKKKLSFSILILISNFLRQMQYRWNRHHSYIVNYFIFK